MKKLIDTESKTYQIAKLALGITVATGTAILVKGALRTVTPETSNRLKKGAIRVAGYTIGAAAADWAMDNAMKQADEAAERANGIKEKYLQIREMRAQKKLADQQTN